MSRDPQRGEGVCFYYAQQPGVSKLVSVELRGEKRPVSQVVEAAE